MIIHTPLSPQALALTDSAGATMSRLRSQASSGHVSDLAKFLAHAEGLRDEADQLAWAIRRMGEQG